MLDIKEIEGKLKNGENVDLECVNIDGLLGVNKSDSNEWKSELAKGFVRVAWAEKSTGTIRIISSGEFGLFLTCEDLKFFRIKEESPYIEDNTTFNDLIDVAVQAMKEGKLYFRFLSDEQVSFSTDNKEEGRINVLKRSCDKKELQDAIDHINSLYTETFVIESLSDIEKIKLKAKFYQNGYEYEIDQRRLNSLQDCKLFLLKGATVTQRRDK